MLKNGFNILDIENTINSIKCAWEIAIGNMNTNLNKKFTDNGIP